jgi:hypothetical protein
MGKPMQDQGMDSRIAGQYLPKGSSRRVTVKDRANILTQKPEHEAKSPSSNKGQF